MDHTDGALAHLAQRDVSFAAVSRAPLSKIEAFKKRLDWRFAWVSSYGTEFNYDYHASFTPEEVAQGKIIYNFDLVEFPSAEAPGISVFYKDKSGNVFHTYSAYARGTESVVNTYNYLDLVPKGRDEDDLYFPMAWVRHHDRYEDGRLADAEKPYWPAKLRQHGKIRVHSSWLLACCCHDGVMPGPASGREHLIAAISRYFEKVGFLGS